MVDIEVSWRNSGFSWLILRSLLFANWHRLFYFLWGSTIAGFILGAIFFKEKIDLFEGFCLFLALLGLYFIYSIGDLSGSIFYALLSLLGGFGAAFWNVFSKKTSDRYPVSQLSGLDFFFDAVIMLCLSLLVKETWQAPSLTMPWFASLLFLLMFIATGQLMIYGFKHLDAQKGSLIMLMEVVFGVIVGSIFFKEILSTGAIFGGIMILTAAALPSLKKD